MPGPLRITRTGRVWAGAASAVRGPRAWLGADGMASHSTIGVNANDAAAHFSNKGMMERFIPGHHRLTTAIMHANG